MNRLLLLFVLVASVLVTSCDLEHSPETNLRAHTGNPGEIIVVLPNNYWKSTLGDTIFNTLGAEEYGLPQPEPSFKLIQVDPNKFGKLFQIHRNILYCDINPEYNLTEPKVEVQKSVWSKDQLVIKIQANNSQQLFDAYTKRASTIVTYFKNKELDRLSQRFAKFGEKSLTKQIAEKHGIQLVLPKDMYLAYDSNSTFWLRLERERAVGGYQHQISQGIIFHTYPYTNKLQFLDSVLLQVKDSLTQSLVLGPSEGSYMVTANDYMPPKFKESSFNDSYAKEIKSLWRMENNFMGGPSITLVALNEKAGKIVLATGYVYAPQFRKREYVREIEAIIKSMQFSEN